MPSAFNRDAPEARGVNYLLVDGRIQRLTTRAATTEPILELPGLSQPRAGEPARLTARANDEWRH